MSGVLAFAAFLSVGDPAAPYALAVAEPGEVASAVEACLEASRSRVSDGRGAYSPAEGWRVFGRPNDLTQTYKREGNRAVVFTMNAPIGTCFVRARLSGPKSIDASAEMVDRAMGVAGKRRPSDPAYRHWHRGSEAAVMESFDDGPGSPPHIIQITVAVSPSTPTEAR